jgi:hypothetical protein
MDNLHRVDNLEQKKCNNEYNIQLRLQCEVLQCENIHYSSASKKKKKKVTTDAQPKGLPTNFLKTENIGY